MAGRSRGLGGRGWRHYFRATGLCRWQGMGDTTAGASAAPFAAGPPDRDIAVLKGKADSLEAALSQVRHRIEELETKLKQE